MLPRRLTKESRVHLVHTSSPVSLSKDRRDFARSLKKVSLLYPRTKEFSLRRGGADLPYLHASLAERLRAFREALKEVDWLLPVYGGTGAIDLVRMLGQEDVSLFSKNRPIANGFSDVTHLLNFLWFKAGLQTFHYTNATGLFASQNKTGEHFLKILSGEEGTLSYQNLVERNLSGQGRFAEGIAVGGNLSTFRDLLDVCPSIKPASWRDFVLFAEDIALDAEDLHRVVSSLDQKGVFRQVRALVLGSFSLHTGSPYLAQLRALFGEDPSRIDEEFEKVLLYLLADTLSEREAAGDPLLIVRISRFGHHEHQAPIIIPIGSRARISVSGDLSFEGPFVE